MKHHGKKKSDELIRSWTYAVRTAPLALWGLVELRLEADEVVSSGAGVTQDDLPTLLTDLAVVLMVRLIAIALLFTWDFMETSWMFFLSSQLTCKSHENHMVLTFLLLLGWPPSLVLSDTAGAVGANWGAVDAGVLLLRLILIHIIALVEKREEKDSDEKNKTGTNKLLEWWFRVSVLTEQLFFLLAPIGDSLILIGAIFLAFAAAFFLSGTRGLLLRFL